MNKEWKDYELEEIPAAPTLSFDSFEEEPAAPAEIKEEARPVEVPDIQLSPEELETLSCAKGWVDVCRLPEINA